AAPIRAAAASPAAASMSPITTRARTEANAVATARPMPRAPPVTATVISIRASPGSRRERGTPKRPPARPPGYHLVPDLDALGLAGVAGRTLLGVTLRAGLRLVHVIDDHVHIGDVEAEQRLHRADDLLAHLVADGVDDEAVLQHQHDGDVGLLAG